MNEIDIIKVGECIRGEKVLCLSCPYRARFPDCRKYVIRDIFDLANRQKAEIERLEKVQVQYVKAYFDEFVERLKNDISLAPELDSCLLDLIIDELVETMKNEFSTLADFTDLIKAEAVEYALEWLQENQYINHSPERRKQLAKEMVGDAE